MDLEGDAWEDEKFMKKNHPSKSLRKNIFKAGDYVRVLTHIHYYDISYS
jgi:hypothetical protein